MKAILLFVFIYGVLPALCLYGYVANIVELYRICCGFSGEMLLRAAGVFLLPLGVVMGFV